MKRSNIVFVYMTTVLLSLLALFAPVAPVQANAPGRVSTLRVAASPALIRHIEYSGLNGNKPGRPNVTPAQVGHDVAILARRTDLITMTEVITRPRARAFHQPGWGMCWKTGLPTAIQYRKTMFQMVWCGSQRVASVKYYQNMSGRWVLPGPVTAALLKERATGKTVLVTLAHTVSCAFSRSDMGWIPNNQLCSSGRTDNSRTYIYRNSFRVRSYKDQLTGWVGWTKQLAARFTPDVTLATGDFNLDYKRNWARQYLRSTWAPVGDMKFGWQAWHDRDYTHLMRTYHGTYRVLLDGDLITGQGVSYQHTTVSFPEMVSSDHSPIETVIALPTS